MLLGWSLLSLSYTNCFTDGPLCRIGLRLPCFDKIVLRIYSISSRTCYHTLSRVLRASCLTTNLRAMLTHQFRMKKSIILFQLSIMANHPAPLYLIILNLYKNLNTFYFQHVKEHFACHPYDGRLAMSSERYI